MGWNSPLWTGKQLISREACLELEVILRRWFHLSLLPCSYFESDWWNIFDVSCNRCSLFSTGKLLRQLIQIKTAFAYFFLFNHCLKKISSSYGARGIDHNDGNFFKDCKYSPRYRLQSKLKIGTWIRWRQM